MQISSLLKLKPNDHVMHSQLGVCQVDGLLKDNNTGYIYGLILEPVTQVGYDLLTRLTGCVSKKFLESEQDLILYKLLKNPCPLQANNVIGFTKSKDGYTVAINNTGQGICCKIWFTLESEDDLNEFISYQNKLKNEMDENL